MIRFHYHDIPFVSSGQTKLNNTTVVGIIDASGSMGKIWKQLVQQYNQLIDEQGHSSIYTITFDTKARCNMQDPHLRTLLNKHGGGGTSLDEPFLLFQNLWTDHIPKDNDINVIFISDGQDNDVKTLTDRLAKLRNLNKRQTLTFMCLGILNEFPTFVSMRLREIYHTGDPNCPSVFLIEYLSEKALFNKFQSIRQHLRSRKIVRVEPSQILIPWEACVEEMPEGTHFVSEDEIIYLPDQKIKLQAEQKRVTSYNISELFRNWTLRLQLDVLNKKIDSKRAEEFALSALGLMRDITEDFKHRTGIDLLDNNDSKEGSNFFNRV